MLMQFSASLLYILIVATTSGVISGSIARGRNWPSIGLLWLVMAIVAVLSTSWRLFAGLVLHCCNSSGISFGDSTRNARIFGLAFAIAGRFAKQSGEI
jgi:hypothetical protein